MVGKRLERGGRWQPGGSVVASIVFRVTQESLPVAPANSCVLLSQLSIFGAWLPTRARLHFADKMPHGGVIPRSASSIREDSGTEGVLS